MAVLSTGSLLLPDAVVCGRRPASGPYVRQLSHLRRRFAIFPAVEHILRYNRIPRIAANKEGDMSETPFISVKGVGHVTMPPDIVVITFRMSRLDRVYRDSVEGLNERVEKLRSAIVDADVDRDQLKTTLFNVSPEYEYDRNKRVFKGWRAEHSLRLELPIDRERLNRVLGAITAADIESQLNVLFEVRDRAALRERTLEDATRAARAGAEAIAGAAGCRLGKVLKMDYGWSEVRFKSLQYTLDRDASALHRESLSAPDIEPEDVDSSDSVTVVWELVGG